MPLPFPVKRANEIARLFAVNLGSNLEYVDLEYINQNTLSLRSYRVVRTDESDREGGCVTVKCCEDRYIVTE